MKKELKTLEMRASVYSILILILLLSCTKKEDAAQAFNEKPATESPEKKVEVESISYKSKVAPEIVSIIDYYEKINKLKPGASQILAVEGTGENEKVTVLVLDNVPIKINSQINKGDKTIISEFYLKDQYLTFIKEVEIINRDSSVLREDHFFFDRNDLLKKVSNKNYEFVFSDKILLQEQQRLRNKLSEYSTLILNQLMKSM